MRAGDHVTYVDTGGCEIPASVLTVTGTGMSWYKVLDLQCESGVACSVPHEKDAPDGPHWREGQPAPRPKVKAKTKKRRK